MKRILLLMLCLLAFAANVYCGDVTIDASSAKSWMTHLPDDERFYNLTIPGSHDSGTLYCCPYQAISGISSKDFFRCQHKSIKEQLEQGIRYFDLRYAIPYDTESGTWLEKSQLKKGDSKDVENWYSCHGDVTNALSPLSNGVNFKAEHENGYPIHPEEILYLVDEIDTIIEFLHENPGEFVLVDFKNEFSGVHPSLFNLNNSKEEIRKESQAVLDYITQKFQSYSDWKDKTQADCVVDATYFVYQQGTDKKVYNTTVSEVTVKDLRGKIVLFPDNSARANAKTGKYDNTRTQQVKDMDTYFQKYQLNRTTWTYTGNSLDNPNRIYSMDFAETNLAFHHYYFYDPHEELGYVKEMQFNQSFLLKIIAKVSKIATNYYLHVKKNGPTSWTVSEQADYVRDNCLNKYDYVKSEQQSYPAKYGYGIVAMDHPTDDVILKLINSNPLPKE